MYANSLTVRRLFWVHAIASSGLVHKWHGEVVLGEKFSFVTFRKIPYYKDTDKER